jgi:gas vesicle protein
VWSRRRGLWRTRPRGRPAESVARDFDADWIYGDRDERKPRPHLRETEEKARSEAEAIVREAELKAHDILAESERERSRVEAELARERADLAAKSKRLSEFLANTLEEVERASANGSSATSVHDLEELEALQDELRGTE